MRIVLLLRAGIGPVFGIPVTPIFWRFMDPHTENMNKIGESSFSILIGRDRYRPNLGYFPPWSFSVRQWQNAEFPKYYEAVEFDENKEFTEYMLNIMI